MVGPLGAGGRGREGRGRCRRRLPGSLFDQDLEAASIQHNIRLDQLRTYAIRSAYLQVSDPAVHKNRQEEIHTPCRCPKTSSTPQRDFQCVSISTCLSHESKSSRGRCIRCRSRYRKIVDLLSSCTIVTAAHYAQARNAYLVAKSGSSARSVTNGTPSTVSA